MRVMISFDVEVWCGGWSDLDARFPAAFERYIYGRSARGDFALPRTLEVLAQHGLQAVFFVESLFARRFGQHHLAEVARLIGKAGHDVQLHVHPEWTDEIDPPLLDGQHGKRQHLSDYTLEEQTVLIATAKRDLELAKGGRVSAFRAGSYAANADTYRALLSNGILIDSSLNAAYAESGPDLARNTHRSATGQVHGVNSFPVTVFSDGLGRQRPAQVGACGFGELCEALARAHDAGCPAFVIVSRSFEMLRPGSSTPDRIVERRFDRLCQHLAMNHGRYQVGSYPQPGEHGPFALPEIRVGLMPTLVRHAEQARRRLG